MAEPTPIPQPIAAQPIAPKVVRPKRGRWLKRGIWLLLILGLCGWFAPTIIAVTVLRHRVPKLLVPKFSGTIELGEMSLGWLSPVVIKDLRVEDEDGHPLLEVQQFSTSESLWTLATRAGNLGTFKIVEPVVHICLRNDGSNIEDLLAKFGGGPASNKPAADVMVEIEDARVVLEHKEANGRSTIAPISFRLVSTKGAIDEIELAVGTPGFTNGEAAVPDETTADWLIARYGSRPNDDSTPTTADTKHAVLRASHWKLDRLGPGLPRVMPKAELSGELNADASVTLTSSGQGLDWDWSGTISIEKLLVAGIAALKQDRLALARVELSGRAATTGGRLAMHDLKVTTDVGELTATGDVPLDSNSQKSSLEWVQSLLSDEDYHIGGHIDLKKMAALLPQTLRIREGTEITGGDVKVQFVGDGATGVRRWSGAAGIVGLTALHQGQTIPWDKPLVARIDAHRDRAAIVVDQMECKSDFLQVKGSGTLDDARFTASGDLSKLLENLERFVDLGIEQLSGQLRAEGELRRIDNDGIGLTSKILLDDFAYVVSKNNVWREHHLELSVSARGLSDAKSRLTRIDTGEFHLNSGGDTFDLRLGRPIDFTSKTPEYSATADVKGNLTSWQNRLHPFVAVADWKVGGTIDLATTIAADPRQVDVSRFAVVLRGLEADGPGWMIQDPEMKLETTGLWDIGTQTWTSPKTTLIGNSLTMRVDKLECALGKQGLAKLTGNAEYRADLKQISHWKNATVEKPSHYLIGSLTGTASVTQQAGVLTGNLDTQVEKFILAGLSTSPEGQPGWVALWKEPQLKLSAKGAYDGTADKLTLDSSSIAVEGLSVGAKGRLDHCSTKQQIDLSGDLAYDWDTLVKRFGDQLGKNIQLSGKDRRPFSMKGSLASPSNASVSTTSAKSSASPVSFRPDSNSIEVNNPTAVARGFGDLSGQAGLGWTNATVYGIVAGPGDVSAQLDNGVCQFAPLDIAVNEGKLHVTPAIHLERNPFLLVLPPEKLIDRVRLSPELCGSWLKFVVPTLADSAQVEGKFSLDMAGASLPLFAPATGSGDGTLSVHRAQVRPGPLALQIIAAIDQVESIISRRQPGDSNKERVWLEMPEQQVPFKLEQGRVQHEGLTFTVKNVSVRTSGSVGVDETLSLIAEIGIRDEWLGNNKVLAGLKGQTIQIPISGTLARPRPDPRAFANLAQQIGGSALEGLLQDKVGGNLDDAINNGLDKLLKRKK